MHSHVDLDALRERADDAQPVAEQRVPPRPAGTPPIEPTAPEPSLEGPPERRWSRPRVAALAGSAVLLALGALTATVVLSGRELPSFSDVLHDAADSQRQQPEVVGSGPIRHVRFVNLADPGAPTYDHYITPEGVFFDHVDGTLPLEDWPEMLSTKRLDSLPTETAGARSWMRRESQRLGLGYPDEPPERAMYRLSTELLVDPSVTPRQKAAVLDVLAGFRNDAIRATSRGTNTDLRGRRGTMIEFRFEEGYVDQMIIDPRTGTLLSVLTIDTEIGAILSGQVYLRANMTDRAR